LKDGWQMGEIKSLKVLHLSDLHLGMGDMELYWSNLNGAFKDDLTLMHQKVGPWDLVLFSGDLVQRGTPAEFAKFQQWLEGLWRFFRALGFDPKFLCLPGNHDLQRPPVAAPETVALRAWFDSDDVSKDFFKSKASPYRKFVNKTLAGYSGFVSKLAGSTIPLVETKAGMLPGDQIGIMENDGVRIGMVALNSTWLQLEAGGYVGKLSVELRQLYELDRDVRSWSEANHFNIITTHQPIGWLHPSRQSDWDSEIAPAGRFDIHLFGHMHETTTRSVAISGSVPRNTLQAPALFGVETDADGVKRIHGYSILAFEIDGDSRQISIWPRLERRLDSGERVFGPSATAKLDNREAYTLPLPATKLHVSAKQVAPPEPIQVVHTNGDDQEILKQFRYHLRVSQAHSNIRSIELGEVEEAFSTARAAWLIGEWGVGSDEFLATALSQPGRPLIPTFKIDVSELRDKDEFTRDIAENTKVSFAAFCDALGSEERLLMLDDVRSGLEPLPGERSVEAEIEELASLLLDSCPDLKLVLRSRQWPKGVTLPIVKLSPLDEADVKLYIEEHEAGRGAEADPATVGVLYRLTDGYPVRLDLSLKQLAVTSLEELAANNTDYSTREGVVGVSAAIDRSVRELSMSKDQSLKRAYSLLQALAVFPKGVEFNRIRRFNGTTPFYLSDVTSLTDRALIAVIEVPDIGPESADAPAKILVVPRPVRDYLRDRLDGDALLGLNSKAAEILLGPKWELGVRKWPSDLDYGSPRCRAGDIANASALIVRLLRLHRDRSGAKTGTLVSLAAGFARAIVDGAHFTSAVNFSEDLLPLLQEEDPDEPRRTILRQYSRALRMIGNPAKAKKVCKQLLQQKLSKDTRQQVLVTLALILGAEKDPEATEIAKQILEISKSSVHAVQAQALIAQAEKAGPARTKKLAELETMARKRKFTVIADNITLFLAGEAATPEESEALLQKVAKSAEGADRFYNGTRALLKIIEQKDKQGARLTDDEIVRLTDAYSFLLNERVPWMFNRVNGVLWKAFLDRLWLDQLFPLFRYSSIIWRLRGDEEQEIRHLTVLVGLKPQLGQGFSLHDRAVQYFVTRAAHYGMLQRPDAPITLLR
jgi:predicted MPP superfamily phosphohydrolase